MIAATSKAYCIKCEKERSTLKCAGCLQDFCYNHLTDHRQELNIELDEIETNRDLFREILNEQINNKTHHPLVKQIDKWEEDSIKKIQQTAKECKQVLFQHTNENIHQLEINFNKLTDEIRQIREENDFNEIDLNKLKQKLTQLSKELDTSRKYISIQQDSSLFINKISIVVSSQKLNKINMNTKWKQYASTVAGGYGRGKNLNQLYVPYAIDVDDDDQCIYIADTQNHRIMKWKYDGKSGEIVAGENGYGKQINQLYYPSDVIVDKKNNCFIISDYGNRRVVRWSRQNDRIQQIIISDIVCFHLTMDPNGDLYVSDCDKNEVTRWKIGETKGTIVAGGNGKGNNFNQLDFPTSIFVDQDYSVYVSDCNNHRVMKWMKGAKEGIIVAGGQGQGNTLSQLSCPMGVIADHLGNVYVADSRNHRIMCWCERSNEGSIVVGGNGRGEQQNQLNFLDGLSFDREGNLYVVDQGNRRVQKFDIDFN